MGIQGFNKPNQFREQLDRWINGCDKNVKGYQPKRSNSSNKLPPPKTP